MAFAWVVNKGLLRILHAACVHRENTMLKIDRLAPVAALLLLAGGLLARPAVRSDGFVGRMGSETA